MLVHRDNVKKKYIIPDSLTHSSGTITAVINGVSYQVVLSGLSANTLYYLYLRTNAGVTQLFSSTTIPSAYRISFSEATLVGAFYSNGMTGSIAFGSFVNIEGAPKTQNPIPYLPVINNLGTGTVAGIAGVYEFDGPRAYVDIGFAKDGSNGSGASIVNVSLPLTVATGVTGDVQQIGTSISFGISAVATRTIIGAYIQGTPNEVRWTRENGSGSYTGADFRGGSTMSTQLIYNTTSITSTPLKDL